MIMGLHMDAVILGEFISKRRTELHMTQAELAEKIHVTNKAVSKWENGRGLPDIDNMQELAVALELNLQELLECHVYIYESEPASGITGAIDWIFGSGSGIDGEYTACFAGVEAEKREYFDRRRDWQMSVFFCGAKVHFYIIFHKPLTHNCIYCIYNI